MGEKDCIDSIKAYTRHEHVKITNSGNAAILASLYQAKQLGFGEVLIPDQGGWLTYPEYPSIIGLKVSYLKTDRCLIDPVSLEEHQNKALMVPSYGGYIAEQPLGEISKVCKANGLLLIEDASGSVGHDRLCNGNHSDIIIGSFGEAKIVNHGHGGFISSNTKMRKEIFSAIKPINLDIASLLTKLKGARNRLEFLLNMAAEVKRELSGFNVIHKDIEGINVAAGYSSDEDKMKIIKYCERRGLEHTLCPRYIRVMEPAVCIEIKRLIG
jgi:hypothetical protein